MSLEDYWPMVPLIGIGLCGVAAFGLWVTHPNRKHTESKSTQMALPL
jgi:hypothetical protein